MELLDGTLKFRYRTTLFTMHLQPWSLPKVSKGGGKRHAIAPGNPFFAGSNVAKRVQLTRKTRPGETSMVIPDPGNPTPKRWKRLCPPSSGKWGVRWACLAIFFLDLGLGEVCTGQAWNLPSEGIGVGFFPAGQSSRRGSCSGTDPFIFLHALTCMDRHTLRTTTTTKGSTRLHALG